MDPAFSAFISVPIAFAIILSILHIPVNSDSWKALFNRDGQDMQDKTTTPKTNGTLIFMIDAD